MQLSVHKITKQHLITQAIEEKKCIRVIRAICGQYISLEFSV